MFGTRKGQGATEYLVLLAVVLIIALVSIALLGFFPGLAGDARKTQSDSYWRGEARPFQILEHSCNSATLTLVVQNSESDKRILNTTKFDGDGTLANVTTFAGGETKTLSITNVTCGTAGTSYEFTNVTFTYNTPKLNGQTQIGSKPLLGKAV